MSQSMQSIDTISEFLQAAGVSYQVFDLSRTVRTMPAGEFAAIEKEQASFPAPRQQHAWLGILFWQPEQSDQHYVWFAKLPLDERGLLQHAARQHFLSIITDALGSNLTKNPAAEQEKLLEQNPYIFKPDEPRRAAFHALASVLTGAGPSIHYEAAEAFLLGKSEQDWESLGVQGIHDFVVRDLSDRAVQQAISQNFNDWPEPLQEAVAEALSHQNLPETLAQNLIAQADAASGLLQRALSHNLNCDAGQIKVRQWLQSEPSKELLISLAARCWSVLNNEKTLLLFMDALAKEDAAFFEQVFKDIVMLPEVRPVVLSLFSQNKGSKQLGDALKLMAQRLRTSAS